MGPFYFNKNALSALITFKVHVSSIWDNYVMIAI